MFAGRSSVSKTHVSSYALLCCLFLIVLDIDHVTSMSLDKLVVERNEIGQDLTQSVENSAKTGNSDGYVVMLPSSQEDFERNTIEDNVSVGAVQDDGDMLMMETNDTPAIQVVQLPEGSSKMTEAQNVKIPESLMANEDKSVTSTPIALMLAELAQQQIAAQDEKAVKVEKAAAELKQDAPQVIDEVAQASSNEDSESQSVAEMILEAVEGMQEALANENKVNEVQEQELAEEAQNEILGDTIQDEIVEAEQSNESKEPLTEQLENQVAADVGENILENLEATVDDIPSEEYVDPEAGVEALTPDEDSVEDQEVAESEVDSVTESVVQNIVPGNLVSNKLFIEEPIHNSVHGEVAKPLEETQKTDESTESEPMASLNAEQSEVSEVEPEEAEAFMVQDEEIDAEEAGEDTMEKNDSEEVEKVSQDEAVPVENPAIAEKIEQVQVPEEIEKNQGLTQVQIENLIVAENSDQVQTSEESQAVQKQAAVENDTPVLFQVQEENQKLSEKQDQTQADEENLEQVHVEENSLAEEEKLEQTEAQKVTQAAEENALAEEDKLEQSEAQKKTQAAEENQEQAQVQKDTQAEEEAQASEETQAVEENQEQHQKQESHDEALEKLEEADDYKESHSVEDQTQNESQSHKENQGQGESPLKQAEAQKETQAALTPEQSEDQDLVENSDILEKQDQAEVQDKQTQEQALLHEKNHDTVTDNTKEEEKQEETTKEQEIYNEEQSVEKEIELQTNLVNLPLNEKQPEEEPQKAEKQSTDGKKEEQLSEEEEKEETLTMKEESEEKQKLEELPKVEEEKVQDINEPTIEIEKEEVQNTNESTVKLDEVEELEHNDEKQIEEVEKVNESPEESNQHAEQTFEEQNENIEEAHQEADQQTAEEHRQEQKVPQNEAEEKFGDQSQKQEEHEQPQKEAEQTIEEHKENYEEQKETEKESIQEQDHKPEQIVAEETNTDNLQEEQHAQSVLADTIQKEPQTLEQNGDEALLIDQNLEGPESHLAQETSAVNRLEEVLLPVSNKLIVPQDEVPVLQEVNEHEDFSNVVVYNDVAPQVEAENLTEPAQEIAIEQDEASSEATLTQTKDEQTQKIPEHEPVKFEEKEEEVQNTIVETEKEAKIEAKPVEVAEIEEPAQIQVQSMSNTIAPEQADDVGQVDVDKTQNVKEPQQIDNHSSMLATIVQVPQLQQQQPQMTLAQPIQQNVVEEVPTKIEPAAEEKQPMPISSIANTMTGPLNAMDSVLNYVNASFINNNNNNKKKEPASDDNEFSSQLRRYDGAQVWRIVVQNDRDKKLVDELQTKYDAQLWKEVKAEVDYLLKPQVLADAEKHIRRANLSRIVLIDNLQKVIEVENPPAEEIAQLQNRKGHRMTWQAYHRLEDIHGFFDYLAKTYPDICSVETIGYSIEKRALKILKISNGNSSNPGIWMDGGMHAREWISPASVTFIANQLVEGWDDLPAYMRNVNWYIHAVANPDGYEYTHTTDRLWRKNMRSHGRQCPGVDLNRNFGYKWGGKGTSANPCSQIYRGSKAFSEPETFYISKFISNFPRETFQAYLSFHSYGQYILYPWGYDHQHSTDRAELDLVARQAGTTITKSSGVKYTIGSSATTLYPAAGGSDDWAKGIAGIKYSYTIEMGDTGRYGFVLPASMIEKNGKDGFTFVETVARAVTNQDQDIRRRALYKRYTLKSF